MAKIHEIDGKKYVEVARKAKVGEKVIVVYDFYSFKRGQLLGVIDPNKYGFYDEGETYVDCESNQYGSSIAIIEEDNYRVLETIEEECEAKPDVTDLLANLACRVASIEQQLTDAQRNIERQSYELAETDAKAEMLLKDIVMLDERTSTDQADVVTFDKFLDSVADKVAERLVGGGRK